MSLDFLSELDRAWMSIGVEPIDIKIIGSAAIFLQSNYDRATRDNDVLELDGADSQVYKVLKELAGKNSRLAKRNGIYLDIVPRGLLLLPSDPAFVILEAPEIKNFRLQLLDLHDVVISKLKPYRLQDQEDIRWLVEENLIEAKKLLDRFKSALEAVSEKNAEFIVECVENFHEVQREFLRTPETPISLPTWIKYI